MRTHFSREETIGCDDFADERFSSDTCHAEFTAIFLDGVADYLATENFLENGFASELLCCSISEELTSNDGQKYISRDHCSIGNHHAKSVCITIKDKSEITPVLLYFRDEGFVIRKAGSIGVVRGERSIRRGEDVESFFSQNFLQECLFKMCCRTVAVVDSDFWYFLQSLKFSAYISEKLFNFFVSVWFYLG